MRKEVIIIAAAAAAATAAAVGGALVLKRWKEQSENRWKHTQRIFRKLASDCATPVSQLWLLANDLAADMQLGLSSDESGLRTPSVPSYFGSLPTGDERGMFYGINLRGNSVLILRAHLEGKNEPITDLQRLEIEIPENIHMSGDSKDLFDFIVLELSKFFSSHEDSIKFEDVRLGFTISSPVHQAAASACNAVDWGNLNHNTVRAQLTSEINRSLEKHGVEMRVSTIVDDVVGDLAGGRYYSRDSVVAISLGMGTNVAYAELAQEAQKLQDHSSNAVESVFNMEWGDFSSVNLPLSEFDSALDFESTNPGRRIFEKLISGMYLGEIVRRILVKMAKETALFGETVPPKLMLPYTLRSPDMAAMHQDTSENYEVVEEKLKDIFEISSTTQAVREVVVEICDIVAERGSRLVGAGIVGMVKKLGRIGHRKSVVTIEGGLYEHYRIFRNYLHSTVWEMLGSELSDDVMIEHSHGGSGAGAIFIAASHTHISAPHSTQL